MEVLPYFALNGFKCEEHDNPADFVLDILIESSVKLQTAYLHSKMHSNLSEIIENEHEDHCLFESDLSPRYFREFYYIAQRTFCHVLRNPALVTSQIVSVIIYGLFTGLIFNKLERTVEPGVYNRFGAIFFIISCQVLGAMSALEPLIKERALFIHVEIQFFEFLLR
jgi:ATP-binding cassette subfamily G (WHITE) protein 2